MNGDRNDPSQPSVLRIRQLTASVGFCRSKVYYLMDKRSPYFDPTFPKPIRLGQGKKGAVGWLSSEIQDWLSSRPRA